MHQLAPKQPQSVLRQILRISQMLSYPTRAGNGRSQSGTIEKRQNAGKMTIAGWGFRLRGTVILPFPARFAMISGPDTPRTCPKNGGNRNQWCLAAAYDQGNSTSTRSMQALEVMPMGVVIVPEIPPGTLICPGIFDHTPPARLFSDCTV